MYSAFKNMHHSNLSVLEVIAKHLYTVNCYVIKFFID